VKIDKTVKDWEITALQQGYPMNRRVRRAAWKKTRRYIAKVRGYAIRGSQRAQAEYVSLIKALSGEIQETIDDGMETLEELESVVAADHE